MTMEKDVYALSEAGRRETNEDLCVLRDFGDGLLLAAVIDGCGGHDGGDYAAMLAGRTIESYVATEGRRPDGDTLLQAVVAANNNIIAGQVNPRRCEMRCVATACLVDESEGTVRLHIAHVGDTRLYAYSRDDDRLVKMTPDHSYVGRMYDAGALTEEEARRHPRRNVISRCLGSQVLDSMTRYLFADTVETDADMLLLCSDGLYDAMSGDEIKAALRAGRDAREICERLVAGAYSCGSSDNISAIIIRLR